MATWLNYHHLLYFWTVAREGGLAPAGKVLRLSHPTLSTQIHALEEQLGEKLFTKQGRKLVLTEKGQVVYRYAEDIFSLGREMIDTIKDRRGSDTVNLDVGIMDSVPKLIAEHLLKAAFTIPQRLHLSCHEGDYAELLARLTTHSLDIVIADAPIPAGHNIRAFTHLLGESGVSFFAPPKLAKKCRGRFPRSLDRMPMVLPLNDLALRRALEPWFEAVGVHPEVVAEFADSALLNEFGSQGHGIFPGPTAVEREIVKQYGVVVIGRTDKVRERFYAISTERKFRNPAVVALHNAARKKLFS